MIDTETDGWMERLDESISGCADRLATAADQVTAFATEGLGTDLRAETEREHSYLRVRLLREVAHRLTMQADTLEELRWTT